ncbi:MAG: hypothetical protein ACI94Y_000658 [Maribacter sp.]|jgi:hypothetical protein
MFLRIGDWSDKHDYLLCCDKSPKGMERYGKVYDGYDDSPWYLDSNYDEKWDDFSSFLHSFYKAARDEDV